MFKYIAVKDLKVNPQNSGGIIDGAINGREYDRLKIRQLKKTRDKRTFIIVSRDLEVLDGHHRLKAYDKKRILCWVWPDGPEKPSYKNVLEQNTVLEHILSAGK